ncbi:MAG: flavodoxin family protein [Chloroflexi bacterium]|nr:flavodoxin family protein [Chloroflexota bacterium]
MKGGNVEVFLGEAIKTAADMGDVRVDLVTLAGKHIGDCHHCNWCLAKQEEGKFCAVHDDMVELYPKILAADVLLLATPAYAARLSGYLATFLDRFRCLVLGKHYRGILGGKVGGALTVAWLRNAGVETSLLSVVSSLLAWGFVVVTPGEGSCEFGAAGLSSEGGTGKFDPKDRLGVLHDTVGMKAAHNLGRRTVEMARTLKAGRAALKAQ